MLQYMYMHLVESESEKRKLVLNFNKRRLVLNLTRVISMNFGEKQNIEVPSVQNLAFLAMTNQGGRGRIILETTECIYSRTLPNDHLVQEGSSLLRAVWPEPALYL